MLSPCIPPLVRCIYYMDDDWCNAALSWRQTECLADVYRWCGPLWDTLLVVVVLWASLIVTQGLFGITVGKWLLGIRVVGARLRPCGLARSLLREALMFVDIFEPGTYQLLVSDHQQRIGDQYADTVVVDRVSLSQVRRNPLEERVASDQVSPAGSTS